MNTGCNHCFSLNHESYNDYGTIGFGVKVVRCIKCGHIYSLIHETIDYHKFYNEGKYVLQDNRGSFFDRIIKLNNSFIVKRITRLQNNSNRLLDFGCGKGQFLSLFRPEFWQVVGIETSKPRARFASEHYGINVYTDFYESGAIEEGMYDVITLFHVLEHLSEPERLLKGLLESNLKEEGLVVIEVPLIESWQSQIGKSRWIHLDPPIHFSHYSKMILDELLQKLQIRPIGYSFFSLPLGILGMCQAIMSRFGYGGRLIEDLKFYRSPKLLLSLLFVLPFSVLLELIAVFFKKGGIIRVYGRYCRAL